MTCVEAKAAGLLISLNPSMSGVRAQRKRKSFSHEEAS